MVSVTKRRIRLLLVSAVLLLAILISIQFYLVAHTFKVTKEAYFREVSDTIKKINDDDKINALREKILFELKDSLDPYIAQKTDRKNALLLLENAGNKSLSAFNAELSKQLFRNKELAGVKYTSEIKQIIISTVNFKDTMVLPSKIPVSYIGKEFSTKNLYQMKVEKDAVLTINGDQGMVSDPYTVAFKINEFIDISGWEQKVFARMSVVFLAATFLIFAMILLFLIIIRALLKQRKLTEIKTDFANNITHELQTPLSSLHIIIKSLEREEVQNNPVLFKDLLISLNSQYLKIQQSVNSVIDSAVNGKNPPEMTMTDMPSFLNTYKQSISVDNHLFSSIIAADGILLPMNIPLLERVLNNLVENALKYTPEGTKIELSAGKDGNFYVITLRDEGPGIKKKNLAFIFDKFYRISEQNKHQVKGLGLGLYLSKKSIISLGGVIFVESTPEKGTRFIIKFPLYEK